MPGYLGSEAQARLQRIADESASWSEATAGACLSGRMIGCDDIEKLGWPTALQILERDGIVGFRMVTIDDATSISTRLAGRGYRLDLWNVFTALRSVALARTEQILAEGLPGGLSRIDLGIDPEDAAVRAVQSFLLNAGVVPFSGSMLLGEIAPAVTVVLADARGAIVASAHAYLPHNRHSQYHRFAWGGLVAVADTQRGRGFGRLVNAMMVEEAFRRLDIDSLYELVSETNEPSKRMIEACGLVQDATLRCGLAVPTDRADRFTR